MVASVLMKIRSEHCRSQLQETRQKYPLAMEEEKIPLQFLKAAEVYKALIKLSHHSIKCLETIIIIQSFVLSLWPVGNAILISPI
jgi:hypothetical protein